MYSVGVPCRRPARIASSLRSTTIRYAPSVCPILECLPGRGQEDYRPGSRQGILLGRRCDRTTGKVRPIRISAPELALSAAHKLGSGLESPNTYNQLVKTTDTAANGLSVAQIRGREAIHTRNGRIAIVVAVVLFAVIIVFAALVGGPWAEYWRIAIPGLLTGIGTLALAGVTVWLSIGQRLRDDELRNAEALRDARKVFGICRPRAPTNEVPLVPGGDFSLYVINASPGPIFMVEMLGEAKSPLTGAPLKWNHGVHQEGALYVLPSGESPFAGYWLEVGKGPAQLTYWAPSLLPVTVEWTDGRGHLWERCGFAEPKLKLAR